MRVYVLVRKDLAPVHQAVQAGHALAGWLLGCHGRYRTQGGYGTWENGTLVYLHVEDEAELLRWHEQLTEAGAVLFREVDMAGQATALAVGPEARKLVRDLRLMAM